MNELLSSPMTFFFKFIYSVMWFPPLLFLTFVFPHGDHETPIMIIAVGIPIAFYALWRYSGIKKVRIENNILHVSNYLRSEAIPIDQIVTVRDIFLCNGQLACIEFNNPNRFGKRITFLPALQLLHFRPHPKVAELKAYIETINYNSTSDNKGVEHTR